MGGTCEHMQVVILRICLVRTERRMTFTLSQRRQIAGSHL